MCPVSISRTSGFATIASRQSDTLQLRIFAGSLAGRSYRLEHARVRPTRQVVREAQLNILRARQLVQPDVPVLVPFAGSGITGFDVHSVFDVPVVMVDTDAKLCRVIQQCAENWGISAHVSALRVNVRNFRAATAYQGLLLDPPFHESWSDDWQWLSQLVADTSAQWIVYESEKVPPALTGFRSDTRRFGASYLTVLERESAALDGAGSV